LADLLDIRHNILAVEATIKLLRKELPLPDETEVALKALLMTVLPAPERLSARYEEALYQIAATRPLVAFRLRSKDQVTPLLQTLRTLASSDPNAAKAWSQVEPDLVSALQKHLDQVIREVAHLYGWRTWWRIWRALRRGFAPEPETERVAKALVGKVRQWVDEMGQRRLRAEADLRAIASAVSLYSAHAGALPPALSVLTVPTVNKTGLRSSPFLSNVPSPPAGWSAYSYTPKPDGLFTISATGDGMTIIVP